MTKDKTDLRSKAWFGGLDKDGFIHRSSIKMQGYPDHVFDGRPVIGICNTWSEFNPCNAGLKVLAEGVKRGVWEAGGLPLEFPVSSLGEDQMRPTAMLFRNLLAMDVEEAIRSHGMDGVVLLGGCDKTTPGQLLGAASVDLPTIVVSAGPALSGNFRGKTIGSGTDVWKFSEEVRAGTMKVEDFIAAESAMSRSVGVCNTMGTASTIASMTEIMGLSLPMNASYPAVDARRMALSHLTGMKFFYMTRFTIGGCEVRALRHGMAGEPGLEIWGPWEEREKVHAAILEVGKAFNLTQVGGRAYHTNVLESGWWPRPIPAIYSDPRLKDYRDWLGANCYEAVAPLGGSFYSENIEDYYCTPFDLDYGRLIAFDHDFIGREALEKMVAEGRDKARYKRTLVWNAEDVTAAIGSSMFGEGPGAKFMNLPVALYDTFHCDRIEVDGKVVGISNWTG